MKRSPFIVASIVALSALAALAGPPVKVKQFHAANVGYDNAPLLDGVAMMQFSPGQNETQIKIALTGGVPSQDYGFQIRKIDRSNEPYTHLFTVAWTSDPHALVGDTTGASDCKVRAPGDFTGPDYYIVIFLSDGIGVDPSTGFDWNTVVTPGSEYFGVGFPSAPFPNGWIDPDIYIMR